MMDDTDTNGTVEPNMDEVFETAEAITYFKRAGHWPPVSLRGSVKPCNDGGVPHWHFECIAALPSGVVAHYFDPEHYSTARVAMAVLGYFAQEAGRPDWTFEPHERFVHSNQPELKDGEPHG